MNAVPHNGAVDVTEAAILAARPPRNRLDVRRPYAFLVEPERRASGAIEDVATIFLTNRECPFRCLMCDLWRNTTEETVPPGAIVEQIDFALERLPSARHVKLYNSGNFFDSRAIPRDDHAAIADRVRGFDTVVVENHPRLCDDRVTTFRDRLGPGTQLEVALGLETIHPTVLPRLNKRMTVADYDRACAWLAAEEIAIRTFVLLRPPYLAEDEGLDWALRSVDHAFDRGAGCVAVIPTRVGNGIMEQLAAAGEFATPSLASLEAVLERGLEPSRGRLFVDLWDAERFYADQPRAAERVARLARMNLEQSLLPSVDHGDAPAEPIGVGEP